MINEDHTEESKLHIRVCLRRFLPFSFLSCTPALTSDSKMTALHNFLSFITTCFISTYAENDSNDSK